MYCISFVYVYKKVLQQWLQVQIRRSLQRHNKNSVSGLLKKRIPTRVIGVCLFQTDPKSFIKSVCRSKHYQQVHIKGILFIVPMLYIISRFVEMFKFRNKFSSWTGEVLLIVHNKPANKKSIFCIFLNERMSFCIRLLMF